MSETSYTPVDYPEHVDRVEATEVPPTSDIVATPAYPRIDHHDIISWVFKDAEALYVDNVIRHQSSQMDVIADKDITYQFKALTPANRFITNFDLKTIKTYFNLIWPGDTQYLYAASFQKIQKVLTGDGTILLTYTPPQDWLVEPSSVVIDSDYSYFVRTSATGFKTIKLSLNDMTESIESTQYTFTPQSYNIRIGIHYSSPDIHLFFREGNVLTYKRLQNISLAEAEQDYAVAVQSPNEKERLSFIGDDGTELWMAWYDGTATHLYHGDTTNGFADITLPGERICGTGPNGWFFTDRKVYLWQNAQHTATSDIWAIAEYKETWMAVSTANDDNTPDMCSIYRFKKTAPTTTFAIADTTITGVGSDERFYGTMDVSGSAIMAGLYSSNGRMYAVRYDGDQYVTNGVTL